MCQSDVKLFYVGAKIYMHLHRATYIETTTKKQPSYSVIYVKYCIQNTPFLWIGSDNPELTYGILFTQKKTLFAFCFHIESIYFIYISPIDVL